MWIRRQTVVQARMPSMRPLPLNLRPPAADAPAALSTVGVPTRQEVPAAAQPGESPAEEAARDGGFHESSYELQHGLQVSESEWPDDVTMPGALGDA